MKALVLARGLGARVSEGTRLKPKPILWHVMKLYSSHRVNG